MGVVFGVFLGVVGTLGIYNDRSLSSPLLTTPADDIHSTVGADLHSAQTVNAIMTVNAEIYPDYWLPEAQLTATAIHESSYLPTPTTDLYVSPLPPVK